MSSERNTNLYLNSNKGAFRILHLRYLFFMILVLPAVTASQTNDETLKFSINKNINTYKFRNTYLNQMDFKFGSFIIDQNYSGTALTGQTNSTREEEVLKINFFTGLYDNFHYSTNQNFLLYSNPKAADNNELLRLSSTHGLKYLNSFLAIDMLGGIEYNRQFGISETGYLLEPSLELYNFNYEGYNLNSTFDSEFLQLQDERKDHKYDLMIGVNKNFNKNDYLQFLFANDYHNRDILTRLRGQSTDNTESPAVENIFDDKYNINFNLGFEVFEDFNTNLRLNYSDISADRYYKNGIPQIPSSLIKKTYNENGTNLIIDTEYQTESFYQKTGAEYRIRRERNNVSETGDIAPSDLERLQDIEKQRDNNSERTRLYSFSELKLPNRINLFFNYSASIYRYNTSSDRNNDDRDLSSFYIETGVGHKFSHLLKGKISFKYDDSHIVFLKSARSGSNYRNLSYSLKPEIIYKNKNLTLRPQLRLLANYTIYDYEEISSGVRSFSFRQISYTDSIYYNLSDNIGLYSRIVLKYYERGILFWEDFSESPELSSNENFIKVVAFVNEISEAFSGLNIGVGFRYYSLKQEGLRQTNTGSNFDRISYGPETIIELNFISGTQLVFNGWYEYQYSDNKFIRGMPNFYLQTRVEI